MRFTTEIKRFLEEKVAERSDWRTSRLSGVIGISQRRKYDNQQPPARPQMSLLSHKQSRLINGKWWHGCARLGTAGKERGCIGTGGAESLEGESGSKQRSRRGSEGGWSALTATENCEFSGLTSACVIKKQICVEMGANGSFEAGGGNSITFKLQERARGSFFAGE